ncbi:MAG: hypothetical protein NVSMB23_16660 [Myxococcales bacterium]
MHRKGRKAWSLGSAHAGLISKEKAPDRTIAIEGKKMKRSSSSRWRGGTNLARTLRLGSKLLQQTCQSVLPSVLE